MKDKKLNDILIGILCALGCEILYGMSFAFSKSATAVASPWALLGWRFLTAAVVMSLCAAAGIVRVRLRGRPIRLLVVMALFFPVIYFIGETFGISLTTASESGAIIACAPAACMAASTLILHKKPARVQVIGMLVSFAGVLVTVFAVGASSSLSVPGYLLLLMGLVSYALYTVRVEKAADYTSFEITFVMLIVAMAVFVPVAVGEALAAGTLPRLISLPLAEPAFLRAVLYQSVGCSILAFFLLDAAISRIGVNRMASFAGLTSVVSILSGAVALHEPFTLAQGIGAAVTIAGVYIANAGVGKSG